MTKDTTDTDARVREIAAGLTARQRESMLLHDPSTPWGQWRGYMRTIDALESRGLLVDAPTGRVWTDLGRAVARVLASQEVDRG